LVCDEHCAIALQQSDSSLQQSDSSLQQSDPSLQQSDGSCENRGHLSSHGTSIMPSTPEVTVASTPSTYATQPSTVPSTPSTPALHPSTVSSTLSSPALQPSTAKTTPASTCSDTQLWLKWLHAPPSMPMVDGEAPPDADPTQLAYGQGAMAWTEGSGEILIEFASKSDRDDAREALQKAADAARAL
jgi:hypothetical protein